MLKKKFDWSTLWLIIDNALNVRRNNYHKEHNGSTNKEFAENNRSTAGQNHNNFKNIKSPFGQFQKFEKFKCFVFRCLLNVSHV